MKDLLYSVSFFSILGLGLLSDGLMDKLGLAGYIGVSVAVLAAVVASILLAEQRRTSSKTE